MNRISYWLPKRRYLRAARRDPITVLPHRDLATVPHYGGRPLIGQSRDGCCWRRTVYRDGVEIVADCGCSTHVGEPHRGNT